MVAVWGPGTIDHNLNMFITSKSRKSQLKVFRKNLCLTELTAVGAFLFFNRLRTKDMLSKVSVQYGVEIIKLLA